MDRITNLYLSNFDSKNKSYSSHFFVLELEFFVLVINPTFIYSNFNNFDNNEYVLKISKNNFLQLKPYCIPVSELLIYENENDEIIGSQIIDNSIYFYKDKNIGWENFIIRLSNSKILKIYWGYNVFEDDYIKLELIKLKKLTIFNNNNFLDNLKLEKRYEINNLNFYEDIKRFISLF